MPEKYCQGEREKLSMEKQRKSVIEGSGEKLSREEGKKLCKKNLEVKC
jgi:hypothetical protein